MLTRPSATTPATGTPPRTRRATVVSGRTRTTARAPRWTGFRRSTIFPTRRVRPGRLSKPRRRRGPRARRLDPRGRVHRVYRTAMGRTRGSLCPRLEPCTVARPSRRRLWNASGRLWLATGSSSTPTRTRPRPAPPRVHRPPRRAPSPPTLCPTACTSPASRRRCRPPGSAAGRVPTPPVRRRA